MYNRSVAYVFTVYMFNDRTLLECLRKISTLNEQRCTDHKISGITSTALLKSATRLGLNQAWTQQSRFSITKCYVNRRLKDFVKFIPV